GHVGGQALSAAARGADRTRGQPRHLRRPAAPWAGPLARANRRRAAYSRRQLNDLRAPAWRHPRDRAVLSLADGGTMEPLTQLERRVYHYIMDFLAEHTYQPSIRDIAKHFRIKSTKTVSDLLRALQAKGFVERHHSRSRGVRLIGHTGSGGTKPV